MAEASMNPPITIITKNAPLPSISYPKFGFVQVANKKPVHGKVQMIKRSTLLRSTKIF